jgi:Subtilase family
MPNSIRILVKLRQPVSLRAAAAGTTARPLFESQLTAAARGVAAGPVWYVAESLDGDPLPWDTTHRRVARLLGIDDADIVYAEPDLPQKCCSTNEVNPGGRPFALGAPDCTFHDQDRDQRPIRIANSVILLWTSVLAQAIDYAIQQNCDVISLSMGGLPSSAWNDAVNLAYESGICLVAASGDCFEGKPTHHVVYPARYHRTIAACGVMADGRPYYDLPITIIEGNWGPDSCMTAAMAAYAPNTPWARLGCPDTINMNGAGTSSSTPQIAAAAALWYEQHKNVLPRDWRRVEAVRHALFQTAQIETCNITSSCPVSPTCQRLPQEF